MDGMTGIGGVPPWLERGGDGERLGDNLLGGLDIEPEATGRADQRRAPS
jgi:hypothetical protein